MNDETSFDKIDAAVQEMIWAVLIIIVSGAFGGLVALVLGFIAGYASAPI